ncbi:MAG: hypothetical protein A2X22_13105 [Bacteroidetes bacterium GWF2_49_14]|nr:MAG: hypothetical protein A2X22_13105 [Bacteroidetes bacterium GWF2_49_14]
MSNYKIPFAIQPFREGNARTGRILTLLILLQKGLLELPILYLSACIIKRKLPHIRKETVEKILEQPYTSPKKIMGQDIKSLNTAKKYLNQMEELGIMSSTKIGKEIVYLNIDLFNLLSES